MINKILEKISGGWIFFFLVLVIYLLIIIFKPDLTKDSFMAFINLLWSILPDMLLVFILIFLTNIFLDPQKTIKYLGKNSGTKGWIITVIGGIISSGPIYMWYPFLADLKKKGMKNSLIAAFLYNRAVKIPLMPLMIYYFGWVYLIVLTIYMIIFSVINGLVVGKIVK